MKTSIRGPLTATIMCMALTVSACAPIPYSTQAYVPNAADVTMAKTPGSGCGLGTDGGKSGYRQIGSVRAQVFIHTANRTTAAPNAGLHFSFIQDGSGPEPLTVSVDPTRIKLQENGRSFSPKLINQYGRDFKDSKDGHVNRSDQFSLSFGAPSGVSDTLRLVFESGAIRFDGRSVPFAPIRYERETTTAVYMFPCIPA